MYGNRGRIYHLVSTQAGVNITLPPAMSLNLCLAFMNKVVGLASFPLHISQKFQPILYQWVLENKN